MHVLRYLSEHPWAMVIVFCKAYSCSTGDSYVGTVLEGQICLLSWTGVVLEPLGL